MKRVALLLGVTAFVVWLTGPGLVVVAAGRPRVAATTAQEGGTTPYYVCEEPQEGSYQCVPQSGCGISNCENDEDCVPAGCDPGGGLEFECVSVQHGSWNPDGCQCTPPPCPEGQVQACANSWGALDPSTCICSNECNPGPPQLVDFYSYGPSFMWCTDCNYGQYEYDETSYFAQFCQDGRTWDQYTNSSVDYFEYWSDQCGYMCWYY